MWKRQNPDVCVIVLRIIGIQEDVDAHENDGIDAAEARPEGVLSDARNYGRRSPGCKSSGPRTAETGCANALTPACRLAACSQKINKTTIL